MELNEYLSNYQPIIYKTFKHALESNQLVHAYLLVGNNGVPLLNIAKYLAKSLLCDNPTPFACEKCITCQRINSNNYPDFIVYNGEKETIKKDDVVALEVNFENKSLEKKKIKIYILHLVENMTTQAINAILKFLEEPEANIYAFLTTNNENLVLPTIISRCQVLHLKLIPREEVIALALEKGVDQFDAELMSYIYNDVDMLENHVNKDNDYLVAKEGLNLFIDALLKDKNEVIYVANKNLLEFINSKQSGRYFFDLLSAVFIDVENIFYKNEPFLQTIKEKLQQINDKIIHVDEVLFEILKTRESLSLNVNVSLILDHIANIIINHIKE